MTTSIWWTGWPNSFALLSIYLPPRWYGLGWTRRSSHFASVHLGQHVSAQEPHAAAASPSFLQNVHEADGSHADHVRQPLAGSGVLSFARLPAQLPDDLGNLSKARRPDRMAHADQSARRVHRTAPVDIERPLLKRGRPLRLFTKPHRFDVLKLLDAERIMQLDQIEVGGPEPRFGQSDFRRLAGEIRVEARGVLVHALAASGGGGNTNRARGIQAQRPNTRLGGHDDRRAAFADRRALQTGKRSRNPLAVE